MDALEAERKLNAITQNLVEAIKTVTGAKEELGKAIDEGAVLARLEERVDELTDEVHELKENNERIEDLEGGQTDLEERVTTLEDNVPDLEDIPSKKAMEEYGEMVESCESAVEDFEQRLTEMETRYKSLLERIHTKHPDFFTDPS